MFQTREEKKRNEIKKIKKIIFYPSSSYALEGISFVEANGNTWMVEEGGYQLRCLSWCKLTCVSLCLATRYTTVSHDFERNWHLRLLLNGQLWQLIFKKSKRKYFLKTVRNDCEENFLFFFFDNCNVALVSCQLCLIWLCLLLQTNMTQIIFIFC